jgi:hypothetical protein
MLKMYPISYSAREQSCLVVLQNCMDLLMVLPNSYSKGSVASSNIKVQEDMDVQEDEDPLLIPYLETKTEHEVSYITMYALLGIFCKYSE